MLENVYFVICEYSWWSAHDIAYMVKCPFLSFLKFSCLCAHSFFFIKHKINHTRVLFEIRLRCIPVQPIVKRINKFHCFTILLSELIHIYMHLISQSSTFVYTLDQQTDVSCSVNKQTKF